MPMHADIAGSAVLGQASSSDSMLSLMIWGAVLLALMLGLGLLIMMAKKKYQQARQQGEGSGRAFDIDTIETYYRSGKISKEEFAVLRKQALGLDKKPASKEKSSSSPPGSGDDES